MRMRGERPKRWTVVYDLDGVITTKDSFAALIVHRLARSPLRLLRALPHVASWAAARDPERRADAARRIASLALRGMREDEYDRLARRLGRRLGSDPVWIRPGVVARIQQQHAGGASIIIATASEERLARALLETAGVPYHCLSASVLTEAPSGMEVLDHRVGARKAAALGALGTPLHEAEFVTDSRTDLPTARLAARVTLVCPSRSTVRRFALEGIDATLWQDPRC